MALDGAVWMVVLGFFAAFLLAMCMGANDVANAFGTSVGSGVLTMRQAILLAGVMNLLGAVSMSGAVTDTIRKGIVDLEEFSGEDEDGVDFDGSKQKARSKMLMLVMLCGMLGSISYVGCATRLAMPVSTTQAILGGLIGGVIAKDRSGKGVRWRDPGHVCKYSHKTSRISCGGVVGIVLQWFIAPVLAFGLGIAVFTLSSRVLLEAKPVEVALQRAPAYMAFCLGAVAFALAWFVVIQQEHHPHSRGWDPHDASNPVNGASALEVVFCVAVGLCAAYLALTIFVLFPSALYLYGTTGDVLRSDLDSSSEEENGGRRRNDASKTTMSGAPEKEDVEEENAKIGDVELTTQRTTTTTTNPMSSSSSSSPGGLVPGDEEDGMVDLRIDDDDDDDDGGDDASSPQDDKALRPVGPENDRGRRRGASTQQHNPLRSSSSSLDGTAALNDVDDVSSSSRRGDDKNARNARVYDPRVEAVFGTAQIATASLAAFAAGANDVANEVAPLAAIYQTFRDAEVRENARTPKWLYVYAGAGIALGLALFGRRVMQTVGKDTTTVTPARGFNIEFGYSLASLIASAEGWPVSTTQLAVGALVGVGMVSGDDVSKAVNFALLRKIFLAWVCTPLTSGIFSALFYFILESAI